MGNVMQCSFCLNFHSFLIALENHLSRKAEISWWKLKQWEMLLGKLGASSNFELNQLNCRGEVGASSRLKSFLERNVEKFLAQFKYIRQQVLNIQFYEGLGRQITRWWQKADFGWVLALSFGLYVMISVEKEA
jgi:hypothetical protein